MEICTVGGFEEVGKNMTAVKVGEDVIIFDVGIYLPPLIELQETEESSDYPIRLLRNMKAVPDDLVLDKLGWTDKVRAIIISHAHLDHVGALPYLAERYPKAELIGTPFTMGVFDSLTKDQGIRIRNKRRVLNPNSHFLIKGKNGSLEFEFLHTTHSTLQPVFIAWNSKDGFFVYALDFKFDNHPVLGPPPNYKRIKELSKKKVKCLVVDSLYSGLEKRTPSERIARQLLEEAIANVSDENSALFITTFSSHIARLKSIVDFGKKTGRKIIFLGRSLNKYVSVSMKLNLCPFSKEIILVKYKRQIDSMLRKIDKERGKYLVVCTGHQGEKGSILDRLVKGKTPFKFRRNDNVIFSSSVIPVPININARDRMDSQLKKAGVRIQADVHVSGHGGGEDLRDFLEMLKPQNIIPAHGSLRQETPMVEIATELGYKFHDNVFLSSNGEVIKL